MEGYKKVQKLGKGTFGAVYLCERNSNEPKIVLKEVYTSLDEAGIKAATNEVRILRALKHPNVIHYFRSFVSRKAFCIVMEYAFKGNLYELILNQRNLGYFNPEKVLHIFCQILHGLNHIHSKNIIHRDLKTENILITGYLHDIIKIADFGISKLMINTNQASSIIGTTNYLAPEICNGRPYDVKSDVWSLGCILYEICDLQRMFDGPITNIVISITTGRIKQINLDVYGAAMQELINSMLTLNPIHRPNTHGLARFPILTPTLFSLQDILEKIQH